MLRSPSFLFLVAQKTTKRRKFNKNHHHQDPVETLWKTFLLARRAASEQERGIEALQKSLEKEKGNTNKDKNFNEEMMTNMFEEDFLQKQCDEILFLEEKKKKK